MILCGVICSAQNINREDHEKLSRYVVGYYVKGYVEKKTDSEWRNKQGEQFKKAWKEFEGNSISKPIDTCYYSNLWACLKDKNLNGEDICEKTRSFYDNIKNKFEITDCDIEELISLPNKYYDSWKNSNGIPRFKEQHDSLKKELETFYEEKKNQRSEYSEGPTGSDIKGNSYDNQYSHKEGTQEHLQTDNSREERKRGSKSITNKGEKQTKTDAKEATPKIRIAGWIFVVIFAIAISFITFLWCRSRKNQHHANVHNSTNMDTKQSNIKLERRVSELEQMVTELSQDIRLLREDFNRFLQKQPESNTFKKTTTKSTDTVPANTEDVTHSYSHVDAYKTLYADSIIDEYFNKVTEKANDDTIFELHVTKNGANISVYPDAIRRIIANPSFLDGCDKQIIGNRIVEIKEQGFAQIQMDGKWKVNKKLNVLIK